MRAIRAIPFVTAALLWTSAAFAHHSFAMFDLKKYVTLEGTVAEFQWTNPHAWIEIDVTEADGSVVRWGVQLNSPNNLTRQGWRRSLLKPGDKVTIIVNPLRDGRKAGLFYKLILADGTVMQDPRPGGAPTNGSGTETSHKEAH